MKWMILLSLFVFVSCGKDAATLIPGSVTTNANKIGNLENDMIIHIIDIQNELSLEASTDEAFELSSTTEGTYKIESEIPVLEGNSGKGWLGLTIGNRKFCYQGNASNAATVDGDKFILNKELSDISANCESTEYDMPFTTEVEISFHDQIELVIEGGGCAVGLGACLSTSVSTVLLLQ
jgi:hypothetical protein